MVSVCLHVCMNATEFVFLVRETEEDYGTTVKALSIGLLSGPNWEDPL